MTSPEPGQPIAHRLVLRVPPWQAAVVFLFAAVAAAAAIYSNFNTGARVFCALLTISTAGAGTVITRAYLVVDADGIYLRTLAAQFIGWDEVSSVEVVVRKNQPGLFVFRDGRKTARIPSFLILPLTPAGFAKTKGRMDGLANRIVSMRPHG